MKSGMANDVKGVLALLSNMNLWLPDEYTPHHEIWKYCQSASEAHGKVLFVLLQRVTVHHALEEN